VLIARTARHSRFSSLSAATRKSYHVHSKGESAGPPRLAADPIDNSVIWKGVERPAVGLLALRLIRRVSSFRLANIRRGPLRHGPLRNLVRAPQMARISLISSLELRQGPCASSACDEPKRARGARTCCLCVERGRDATQCVPSRARPCSCCRWRPARPRPKRRPARERSGRRGPSRHIY
jgi:hypothetical protein